MLEQLGATTWAVRRWPGFGPPIVFLHGFTGTGLDATPLRPALSARPLLAPDLPGHGSTPPPPAGPATTPAAVRAGLVALTTASPCDLVGYSQGGRLALDFACAPEARGRVRRLVLIGASPGLADSNERATRAAADAGLADRLEALGAAAFLAEWGAQPLFARTVERLGTAAWAPLSTARAGATASGLAAALRGLGTAALAPRWADLANLDVPTLLVTGAEDAKFDALARAMLHRLPNAHHVRVPDAHHAAHLENAAACGAALAAFLG